MTTPRAKPYTLDLVPSGTIGELGSRVSSLFNNADTMFQQVYQDLTLLAADVASGAGTGSSGVSSVVDDLNVTGSIAGSVLSLGWTGQLGVTRGGTGLATVATGDILYGSAADTLSALAKSATATRYLANTGAGNIPKWDLVDLSNGVTGLLPSSSISGTIPPSSIGLISPIANYSEIATNTTTFFSAIDGYIRPKLKKYWEVLSGNVSISTVGATANATVTAGTSSFVADARGGWERINTGAVSGNSASIVSSVALVWLDWEPHFMMTLRTGASVAAMRMWIGLWSALPSDADVSVRAGVGFRFSTVAGDTGFTPVTFDGTTQTLGSTLSTVAASEEYVLSIRLIAGGTSAEFIVLRKSTWTVSTGTLSIGSGARGQALLAVFPVNRTQAAAVKTIDVSRLYLDWGLLS